MADNEVGTGYIKIKPEMDEGAKSQLEQSGKSSGQGFGESFKVAAGVLIANAVQAIAQGAVDVFSNAFRNYASYEQLLGGVEKIFDQANQAQILEDAQGAYKDLNMSAIQYLESINQVGATFAQTMGDQKGYDTARKGMKAIADYASGTGRNLDELNQKYALITRATSSYQSIADQFSGILPATSKDFLEQAKAAGFLSDSYTQLTEVPVAEYQEAVTKMLEKGVDAMGLANNTAKESTQTISGSIAMLQASWQNFLTGLFDDNADIGALGERLFDSIGAVLLNVVPRIGVMVTRVFMGIPDAIRDTLDQIPVILAPTINKVFGEELGEQINTIIFDTSDGIVEVISGAMDTVASLMETAWPVIQGIVEGAMTAINAFMTEIWPGISALIDTVMGAISDDLKSSWAFIMTLIKTVMGAIRSVMDNVWPIISSIVQMAMWAIRSAIEGIKPVVDFMKGVFEGVRKAIENPMEAAKNAVRNIIDAIKGLFSFQIQWPHIPLPHFSVSGSPNPLDWLSGGLPSISVDWYAKGGIVNGATLIGAGEAGPEMILPQQGEFMEEFAERIAEKMGGGIVVNSMTVVTPDPEDFMRQLTAFATRTRAQYA